MLTLGLFEKPIRWLMPIVFSLFMLPSANALTISNVAYAEDCNAPDLERTISFSWLELGASYAKNVQAKDSWSWFPVVAYREREKFFLFKYQDFSELYYLDTKFAQLINRYNAAGVYEVQNGKSVGSGRPTSKLVRCTANSNVSRLHQMQRQAFLDSTKGATRAEAQQKKQDSDPCKNDPYAGTSRAGAFCNPETTGALNQILQGVNPLTEDNICPSDMELSQARRTCAPANNFSQCMKRLFPNHALWLC